MVGKKSPKARKGTKKPATIKLIPVWSPQPGPQLEMIMCTWCYELLYGGAKFGGKTDALLGDYLQDVPTYGKNWQGILIRRSQPEFSEILTRSQQLYPMSGAIWKEKDRTWFWPNGASLKLRHLERYEDFLAYNGHSYPWIGVDELGSWPDMRGYHLLKSLCRWGAAPVPTKRIRATANPGGPGHQAVMQYFMIDRYPNGMQPIEDSETGLMRMFIRSLPTDNAIGLSHDPNYLNSLHGIGSATLVRAWLTGDWSVVAGAYFDSFSPSRHVIEPFTIPPSWPRFIALDWGYAKPFCVLWAALSDGSMGLPRNSLVFYREWYGWNGKANEGCRMSPQEVGRSIRAKMTPEEFDAVKVRVADPSIFNTQGGPPIAELLAANGDGMYFKPADNDRIAGWTKVRQHLVGSLGHPSLYLFKTLPETIRTIPILQHDTVRVEDLDTDGEDHAADTVRYLVMSRPHAERMEEPERSPHFINIPTFDTLLKEHEELKNRPRWRQ